MSETYGLGIVLDAQDNASPVISNFGLALRDTQNQAESFVGQISDVESAIQGLGKISMTLGGAGIALTAAGSQITGQLTDFRNAASSYESELATLKFVTQATGEEWDALTAKAEEAGLLTQFSPEEAVQGLYELKSAGLSTADAIEALDATMDFSTMSNGAVALDASASLIASAMNKFNLSAENAYHIADVFSTATQESAYHAEDLSAFINSIGAMPATLGVTLEETMAMGSLLMNIGQGAAQAGSTVQGFGRQIKMLTSQIKSGGLSSKKASAMEMLGIDLDTFWDEEGELRSMVDIFNDIVAGSANLSAQDKSAALQTLFATQATNLETAIEQAEQSYMTYDEMGNLVVDENSNVKKSLDQLITAYQDCNGVTSEGAEMMRGTAKGMRELAEGSVQTLKIKLGELTPAFDNFGNSLKYKVSNALIELIENHPQLANFASGLALVAGNMLKIAGIATLAVAGIAGLALGALTLSKNIGAISAGLSALKSFVFNIPAVVGSIGTSLASLLAPIVPLIVAAGLLYAAWKTDFGGIRTLVLDFVGHVSSSFSKAKEIVGMSVDDFNAETSKLEESGLWWDKLTLKILDFMLFFQGVADVWNDNELSDEMFTKLEERGLIPAIEMVLDFKEICLQVWEGVKEGFEEFSKTVQTGMEAVGDAVGGVLDPIASLLGLDLGGLASNLQEAFGGAGIDKEFWKTVGTYIGKAAGVALSLALAFKVVVPAVLGVVHVITGLVGVVKGVVSFFTSGFIGPIILMIGGAITAVTNFVSMWKNGFDTVKAVIMGVGAVVTAIGAVILGIVSWPAVIVAAVLAGVASVVIIIKDHWAQITQVFSDIWTTITTTVTGIWNAIVNTWNSIWSTIGPLIHAIGYLIETIFIAAQILIGNAMTTISGIVSSAWSAITGFISNAMNAILSVVLPIWNTISGGVSTVLNAISSVVSSIWNSIYSLISGVMNRISSTVLSIWNNVRSGVSSTISGIATTIQNGFNSAVSYIKGLASQAFGWGSDIIGNIVSGIRSKIGALTDAITGVADNIRSRLHFSEPDIGPLADFHTWMPDFVEGMAGDIKSTEHVLVDAVSGLASRLTGVMPTAEDLDSDIVTSVVANTEKAPSPVSVTGSATDNSSILYAILERLDALIGLGGQGETTREQIVFEAGSIVAKVDGASIEDLEDLVDRIVEIIRRRREIENMRSYA